MAFATFGVHVAGWVILWSIKIMVGQSFELPLAYLAIALLLLLVGPGRLSVDAFLFGRGPIIKPDPARELSS